jgi:hypothetical protein
LQALRGTTPANPVSVGSADKARRCRMSKKHDCIERINEQLRPFNTAMAMAIDFTGRNRELIQVSTVKADSTNRKKPSAMFASYCPFCGIKLDGPI